METTRPATETPSGEMDHWQPLLGKLLGAFDGALALQLPDGSASRFGNAVRVVDEPAFVLCLRDPQAVRSLLLGQDPLRFADAYFRGALDVEGDLFAALSLKDHLQTLRLSALDRLRVLGRLLARGLALRSHRSARTPDRPEAKAVRSHSRQENRQAISFHYDLSNDFYGLWLDDGMVYSCAYFEQDGMSLEQAQRAKLDHICRKLQLRPGERFLDIGCGWGALVLHAAQHYGVQAHGITLSQRQFELARERIQAARLEHLVTVELQDYRDVSGQACYDKIASVGMFEHVGLKNLPQYFGAVHRLLKPEGLFLNHGITHDQEGWGEALSSRFINRYVFPDGELDTVGNIQRAMERAQFEILDVEGLRPHYALTLRHWVHRLERRHAAALRHVNESTYRVWRLYMAASALEFESGGLGLYQILSAPRGGDARSLPRTRRYMYPPATQGLRRATAWPSLSADGGYSSTD
jgi:cyclopropane-fatty-acyl-phospholipid synthase